MYYKKVLAIILNYVTYDLTLKLILELKNLDDEFDIMVIDNHSPNESAKVLKEMSCEYNYTFYANKDNSGYAAGNNIGIRYAIENGYTYSWILNNDVELKEKNILSHMVKILEEESEVGSIGPKIYLPDKTICAPYVRQPKLWSMVLGIGHEKKYREKFNNESRKVYYVHGCCMLLKNEVMDQIDCMDERTFLYCEEEILAERMLRVGQVSYYDAKVSVVHNHSQTVSKVFSKQKKKIIYERTKSREIYLKDYRKFNLFERILCHTVRNIIIYFR